VLTSAVTNNAAPRSHSAAYRRPQAAIPARRSAPGLKGWHRFAPPPPKKAAMARKISHTVSTNNSRRLSDVARSRYDTISLRHEMTKQSSVA